MCSRKWLRLCPFVPLFVLTGACTERRQATVRREHAPFSITADSDVALVGRLPRDTVFLADSSPLLLHYYIANGPAGTWFENQPGLFFFDIQKLDGTSIVGPEVTHPKTGTYGTTRLFLPARAVLGQVVNLRCIQDGLGYWVREPGGWGDCLARFHDGQRLSVHSLGLRPRKQASGS